MKLISSTRAASNGSWKPVYGERSSIPDRYREALVVFRESIAPRRTLHLRVRAYDEGVALRHEIPAQSGLRSFTVGAEATEFRFSAGTYVWETYRAQSTYKRVKAEELRPGCERPLLVETIEGGWAAVAEAGNRDAASMFLRAVRNTPGVVGVSLAGAVPAAAPWSSPWRVVMVADTSGGLLERNYLLQNLSPRPAPGDWSWVKPGKVIREVTLSTRGARECADFAAKRGLQYIEFDAGWYGHEYDDLSSAARVNVDPLRLQKDPAYQGLNLREAIRYAKSKGVGVLLYVNRRALERQLPTLLPLFKRWGVDGVKYGFVNTGSAGWTRWLYDAVAAAAAHRLVVDVHDEFRPTGMSRTYPNFLTMEGILGNEGFPGAEHNTILPFTRFLAGAGDYTVCWLSPKVNTTWAHQMALSVAFYSPLQFLYWYDRPPAIEQETPPELLDFFAAVPTVWDETRVVDGRPGEFAVVARRKGGEWFLGAITNQQARTVWAPLSFLEGGRQYEATVYTDGASKREVAVGKRTAAAGDSLSLALASAGGAAVRLSPRP
jgi:alpha-glucosidase